AARGQGAQRRIAEIGIVLYTAPYNSGAVMRNFLAVIAVVCSSGVAFAQQSQNPMSYEALAKAKPGAWAEYTMTMKGQAQQIKMRYAVVEKTDKQMALEIDSSTPMGDMHMAMTFEPSTPD